MLDGIKGMFLDKVETAEDRIRANAEKLGTLGSVNSEQVSEDKQLSNKQIDFDALGIESLDEILSKNPDFISGSKTDIYNVSKFSETLPDTMYSEERKATLKNILNVAGFNIDDLLVDAQNKITYLKQYVDNYMLVNTADNDTLTNEIHDLEEQIQSKRSQIEENSAKMDGMKILISKSIAGLEKISSNIA